MLMLLGILIGLIFIPVAFYIKLLILIGVDIVIALFLSNTLREFYIIMYMMPLCILAFYFGMIRTLFIKAISKISYR